MTTRERAEGVIRDVLNRPAANEYPSDILDDLSSAGFSVVPTWEWELAATPGVTRGALTDAVRVGDVDSPVPEGNTVAEAASRVCAYLDAIEEDNPDAVDGYLLDDVTVFGRDVAQQPLFVGDLRALLATTSGDDRGRELAEIADRLAPILAHLRERGWVEPADDFGLDDNIDRLRALAEGQR